MVIFTIFRIFHCLPAIQSRPPATALLPAQPVVRGQNVARDRALCDRRVTFEMRALFLTLP